MKTAAKIILSLISATVLVVPLSWLYVGHWLVPKTTEQTIASLLWAASAVTAGVILALTAAFYRMVR